jgi:hypothetical protein
MSNYKKTALMKFRMIILLIFGFSLVNEVSGQGLEIYLVKHNYPDFTKVKSGDKYFIVLVPGKLI